ncbi:FecR family protein [Mangrovibacterium diazotrophicum]|uniref:FecR family protein n=1 Tax=Mangrovibacterium diazotrophicum TaxID=1261403 RepID=A0A419W761_9BACT|nr:FecR family protein [Mangrovibacterium diazotrophicum]RKD91299.1 FecR family protein [Mangrovibacterium diazotrophicum]
MKTNSKHSDSSSPNWQKLEELNSKVTVKWESSAEDIWTKMESQLTEQKRPAKVIALNRSTWQWAVAAVFVLLLGTTAFMRFYTESAIVSAGEHRLVELPDQSKVQLNAGSELTWHPYWWQVSREVELDGEAYFEVQKGSRFVVASEKGNTAVLGTSFNIFARDDAYRVTCLTGKVQVSTTDEKKQVVLSPNEKAELLGAELTKSTVVASESIAWITNRFVFAGRPIQEVFDEIERQYKVTFHVDNGINFTYSGNFEKQTDVKQVLGYVCRPFSLKFTEEQPGVFRIEKSN